MAFGPFCALVQLYPMNPLFTPLGRSLIKFLNYKKEKKMLRYYYIQKVDRVHSLQIE